VAANSSALKHQIDLRELDIDLSTSALLISFNGRRQIIYFKKPKALNLTEAAISTHITKAEKGCLIELSSPVLQKDLFLRSEADGHFSDNYFDLLPNEPRSIRFETEADSLTDLKILSFNSFIR
jgi:beta-mannosidase